MVASSSRVHHVLITCSSHANDGIRLSKTSLSALNYFIDVIFSAGRVDFVMAAK
jgi:hypothetical protein